MRGEYCVYGATALSVFSAIVLIFANIAQLSTGVAGLYFAEVNVRGLGQAYNAAAGGSDGVYAGDSKVAMGDGHGLRWYYRYGVYGACGYFGTGSVCNSTSFAYPFQPLGQMMADIPQNNGRRDALPGLIGADQALSDGNYNQVISRSANMLIFIGSALCGVALVVGIIKTKWTFLIATIAASISALFLMIGAAMWSAIIARNSPISEKMLNPDTNIGVKVTAGAALYLVWVAFVFQTLSVAPYVISFLTFKRQSKSGFK